MYCSGEFLFDGCNHRIVPCPPLPSYAPRRPCRPPGASGSLFSSESLVRASLPRRPRYRLTLHDARVKTHQRFTCISRRLKFIALRAHISSRLSLAPVCFLLFYPQPHPVRLFIRNGYSFPLVAELSSKIMRFFLAHSVRTHA